jgi:hypothetical protein
MSKTFYADGQTGKVAIMEGEFSQTVLDNPQANTDKLYFHSELGYLYRVAHFEGNASFSAVPASSWNTREVEMGTIVWEVGAPIIFLGKINGIETNVNLLVQTNNNLGDFRFAWFGGVLTGNSLRCLISSRGDGFYSGLPIFNFSYECSIYTIKQSSSETTFYASTEQVKMNGDKFDSQNIYLRQGGTFKYATGQTINMTASGWSVIDNPISINLNEGI